ncbi:Xylulose 5-phosphate/Fructose 6-phosphate phosphoketolase [Jimgerdemannia flammicorona]|uniref:Xylulose 5-phosphate/Fructose 6-phosphate phosphoketolase n=1 Tax=Jimgerdemannia flammicorona TaxID=994334 RepID=A0A433D7I4_9FUNG|nr:Xylulose 5-phosphate/Fructose 6-phosphate phosphoketolase [Jimgerdemannia flammicorona]
MSTDSEISQATRLLVELDISAVDAVELKPFVTLQRAANYLACAMIFLQDNASLSRELVQEDIKSRLLGHWGLSQLNLYTNNQCTCPGINLVYAHANRLIKNHKVPTILVTGPGHGAPANLANLYLEGSLSRFYPEYSLDTKGLSQLVKRFSWPGGFPRSRSHVNAEVPGQIHEGGELGYALSVSFGAAMDNPDLLVISLIGDGEAETGPTAAAWHSIKYLDPKESGAVLPILHLNGFKISEKTIFGCMDNHELAALFTGYGYRVRIVGNNLESIQEDMAVSLDWAYSEIQKIQKAARSGNPLYKPRWPMIVLRSPKGWTGPKEAHGSPIEGSFHAHQVPLPNVKKDDEEFCLLKNWLHSYHPEQLFDSNGAPVEEIMQAIPSAEFRMGQRPEIYAKYEPLDLADWKKFAVDEKEASEMKPQAEIGACA